MRSPLQSCPVHAVLARDGAPPVISTPWDEKMMHLTLRQPTQGSTLTPDRAVMTSTAKDWPTFFGQSAMERAKRRQKKITKSMPQHGVTLGPRTSYAMPANAGLKVSQDIISSVTSGH